MHIDSMLAVSEYTLIPKLLMAFKILWYRFLSVLLKYLGFGF